MQETRRAVLTALDDGPFSSRALAERLGVSVESVRTHVEALREAGFGVERTDAGYRLTAAPEFGGLAVEYEVDAPFAVDFHESIPSTNDRARELAADGAEDVVVLADEQTGGRGRLDRSWASPGGGVWMSVVLRTALQPAEVPLLTLAAGVATVRSVEPAGVEAGLKWPNDVLVPAGADPSAERKLAGILTESAGAADGADGVDWVVVGVGINANVDAADLPPGATSVREEAGDVVRRRLVRRWLETFEELRADPEAVLPAWREVSSTLGRRVRVTTSTGDVVGEAVDVEAPGTLVVATDDGEVRVHAGDCEHLRPVHG